MSKEKGLTGPLAESAASVSMTEEPAQGEDRVFELGWKYDPAQDTLKSAATVYTRYRDAHRREGVIVRYILIARYERCGPAAAAALAPGIPAPRA